MSATAIDLGSAKNVTVNAEGPVVYIRTDLSKDFGASSTGKTVVIGSTAGNKPLGKSNAFLGLNLFTKSLDRRNLQPEAVRELQKEAFEEVGQGCAWRIEKDGVTVCIKVDLSRAQERPAGSGKSVILATTSGNKQIAQTGVLCGLNLYRPVSAPLDLALLAEEAVPKVKEGQKVRLDKGFEVDYTKAGAAVITRSTDSAASREDEGVAMPTFIVEGATVNLFLGPPKVKKTRKEETEGAPPTAEKRSGLDVDPSSELVKNLHVTYEMDPQKSETHVLRVAFDPKKTMGRSTSGKSFTVSTSGGFQHVLDAEGKAVYRLSFNAYKPAPPITQQEVKTAVATVLTKIPKEERPTLIFQDVLKSVRDELGVSADDDGEIKSQTKEEIKLFLSQN